MEQIMRHHIEHVTYIRSSLEILEELTEDDPDLNAELLPYRRLLEDVVLRGHKNQALEARIKDCVGNGLTWEAFKEHLKEKALELNRNARTRSD